MSKRFNNNKCFNPAWYKNNSDVQVSLLDLLQLNHDYESIPMAKLLKNNNHFQMMAREIFKINMNPNDSDYYEFRTTNPKFKKIYNNFKKSALHYPLSTSDVINMHKDIHSILKFFAGDFIHETYKHIGNLIVQD